MTYQPTPLPETPPRRRRAPKARRLAAARAMPSVSIAIPTLNEAGCIEELIRGFLATSYPNLIEIFVADGGSTDGTRKIVERLALQDRRVRLIHNPQRIQSAGLNLVLAECSGDVFLRADAHCEYAPDYIESCVRAMQRTGAVNVGGAQRFVAQNAFQAGVALSTRSFFGSGGAKYRDPDYDGYVEAIFMGCFRRKALLDVSGYKLMRTAEDAELNLRLLARARRHGEGDPPDILYSTSRIKVWYYPRSSWKALARQYFHYGCGRYRTVRDHPGATPLRGKLPFLAVSAALALFLIDQLALGGALRTLSLGLLGVTTLLGVGLYTALRFRKEFDAEFWRGDESARPWLLTRGLLCGVVICTEPVAHWAGMAFALLQDTPRAVGSLAARLLQWPFPTRSPSEIAHFLAPRH